MRKTKIVCTQGPAVDKPGKLEQLIEAGMNVARFNFSHGLHDEQKGRIDNVKAMRKKLDKPVALLLDSKGPEVRIKSFADGKVELKEGQKFTLFMDDVDGDVNGVSVTYPALYKSIKPGQQILINDGFIEVKAETVDSKKIVCTVINGGGLGNKKSINVPGVDIDMPFMSEGDKKDFLFGIKEGVDYIALSFVRNKNDVQIVKDLLIEHKATDIKLIAKIENQSGVNNLAEILEVADGAMVARGDMGVEIAFDKLPAIQKDMIRECINRGKIVITATQMLESMMDQPRPTRAEVTDVANAVYDGTGATMLSGETAMGKYNVETVKTMAKIAATTESNVDYEKRFTHNGKRVKCLSPVSKAVSHAAVSASFALDAKAIIAVTESGQTARQVSNLRPSCPIIAATVSPKAYQQLALSWGVTPVMAKTQKTFDALITHAIDKAKETGLVAKGDLVVVTIGAQVGVAGTTNTMRVETVK